jgi:hypothetical protein
MPSGARRARERETQTYLTLDAENRSVKQTEKHHNAAEEGDTANIKQNTTNKGFYRGRRMG